MLDHNISLLVVFIMTFWALFAEDIQLAVPIKKAVDIPFAYVQLIFLIIFSIEQLVRSFAQYVRPRRIEPERPRPQSEGEATALAHMQH